MIPASIVLYYHNKPMLITLLDCVKQFEAVGIKITADDFDISEYSK